MAYYMAYLLYYMTLCLWFWKTCSKRINKKFVRGQFWQICTLLRICAWLSLRFFLSYTIVIFKSSTDWLFIETSLVVTCFVKFNKSLFRFWVMVVWLWLQFSWSESVEKPRTLFQKYLFFLKLFPKICQNIFGKENNCATPLQKNSITGVFTWIIRYFPTCLQ